MPTQRTFQYEATTDSGSLASPLLCAVSDFNTNLVSMSYALDDLSALWVGKQISFTALTATMQVSCVGLMTTAQTSFSFSYFSLKAC